MTLPKVPTRETSELLQIIAEALRNNYTDCENGYQPIEIDLEYEENIQKNIPAIANIEYYREYSDIREEYDPTVVLSCMIQYESTERILNDYELRELETYLF